MAAAVVSAGALEQLTPDQREVVVLRFVADLSVRDAARMTRRRVGAVKSLQVRGIARLRDALAGPKWDAAR